MRNRMQNQQLESVLARYPFRVSQIVPVQVEAEKGKGVWKVETDRGSVCLKRTGHPADRIAFSVTAQQHLVAHGAPVPPVIPTRDGSLFVVNGVLATDAATDAAGVRAANGSSDALDADNVSSTSDTQGRGTNSQVYAVYQWLTGRSLRWEDRADLRASVEALARLHAASRGLTVPRGVQVFTKLGRWPDNYAEVEKRLTEWKERAKQRPERGFNALFLEHVDVALELAAKARAALAASPYAEMVQRLWPGDTLIHQDFGPSNLIMTAEGPYLLDLDTVTFEFPARNLRKLASELMQSKGGWRYEVLNDILGWYTRINPLSSEHLQLLAIDLMFPHVFHDAAKNWFKKNKVEKPERLERAARFEREKLSSISAWVSKLR